MEDCKSWTVWKSRYHINPVSIQPKQIRHRGFVFYEDPFALISTGKMHASSIGKISGFLVTMHLRVLTVLVSSFVTLVGGCGCILTRVLQFLRWMQAFEF